MRQAGMLAGGLLLAGNAFALEVTADWTLSTEWFDRGISQTAGNPAVQAGLQLAFPAGVYLGGWGSNVDFGDCCSERLQFDWTLGVVRPWGETAWDAGLTWSTFPGTTESLDFVEYHLGFDWRNYGIQASWTPDFANLGRALWYYQVNGSFALPWQDLRLLLHAGYTRGSALHQRFADETGLEPYGDWQVSLERSFGRFNVTLGWADTDMGGEFRIRDRVERNDGRLFLALSASCP
jgi:uncharacterized protein (TIGR02001 family)